MGRLAADLAETFKEGQAGQASAKQGDLLPSGHPSSPNLTIGNECFCRNVEFCIQFQPAECKEAFMPIDSVRIKH